MPDLMGMCFGDTPHDLMQVWVHCAHTVSSICNTRIVFLERAGDAQACHPSRARCHAFVHPSCLLPHLLLLPTMLQHRPAVNEILGDENNVQK